MKQDSAKQIKLGMILSYINLGIGNLIPFFYTPIMLELLGQSEYGLYKIASSTTSFGFIPRSSKALFLRIGLSMYPIITLVNSCTSTDATAAPQAPHAGISSRFRTKLAIAPPRLMIHRQLCFSSPRIQILRTYPI